MASITEPGDILIVVDRQQHMYPLLSDRNGGAISAGGSPDGVLANKTNDKWVQVPRHPLKLRGGDVLRVLFKKDAAGGTDASDAQWYIPITEDGRSKVLTKSSFGFTADFPAATGAGQWLECGTGYTIPNSVTEAHFGGGGIVVSIEDDTA